ncbi:hypothetical protein ACKKBF_B38445 [Auxenochlorella protothecoides x Auxenochlorella symbiontica]
MSYSASHGYRSIAELASQAPNFTLGILGDLHLSPDRQMRLFEEAKDQLVTVLESQQAKLGGGTACQAGLIQLGDVGGYHHQPGSLACFQRCRDWLAGFDLPVALITGNHDLEGLEFKTDALNLAAWQETFQQEHHWRVDVGPAILLGLGTSRFRSNQHSAHEVHVDAEQLAWFRNQLDASQGRPVIVFSHAPILGSGVRSVLDVHVKNRCAWLNHSTNPHVFMELVESHPNIHLWFSGHFHLSHNYADSISVVGRTAFATTGVIGKANRDGFRHSWVLSATPTEYRLQTLDHGTGRLRLDLVQEWGSRAAPAPRPNRTNLLKAPSVVPVMSALPGLQFEGGEALESTAAQWFQIGNGAVLGRKEGLLVEYEAASASPIGVVLTDLEDDHQIRFRGADGGILSGIALDEATSLEVHGPEGDGAAEVAVLHSIPRNAQGTFYQIFQRNKWQLRLAKESATKAHPAATSQ